MGVRILLLKASCGSCEFVDGFFLLTKTIHETTRNNTNKNALCYLEQSIELLRQAHFPNQLHKPRIAAQAVVVWIYCEVLHLQIMRSIGFFQRCNRTLFVAHTGVEDRQFGW